jgi:hypothetical protein
VEGWVEKSTQLNLMKIYRLKQKSPILYEVFTTDNEYCGDIIKHHYNPPQYTHNLSNKIFLDKKEAAIDLVELNGQ